MGYCTKNPRSKRLSKIVLRSKILKLEFSYYLKSDLFARQNFRWNLQSRLEIIKIEELVGLTFTYEVSTIVRKNEFGSVDVIVDEKLHRFDPTTFVVVAREKRNVIGPRSVNGSVVIKVELGWCNEASLYQYTIFEWIANNFRYNMVSS